MNEEQLKSEIKILRSNIQCYYDQASHLRGLENKKDVIEAHLTRTAGSVIVVKSDTHNPNEANRLQLIMDYSEVNTDIETTKAVVRSVEKFFRSLSDRDLKLMRDYAKGKLTIVELSEKYGYSRDGVLWRIKALMRRFILNHTEDYTKCIKNRDNMIV